MTTIDFTDVTSAAIEHLSRVDPVLQQAIEVAGPCTIEPHTNLFHELVDSILSQQISVKAAASISARLRTTLPEGKFTPEALLALEHETLRTYGLSASKARYIHDLSQRVASGQLNLEQLPTLDDEAIIKELTAVKGIGRWTSEMMLIFALGRADILPVDDLGLVEAVRQAYNLPERPTKAELITRAEIWRPYRTFATWYLWRWRRHAMGLL
jgi:DNA-3-methyladenine glycosylase II